MLLLPKITENQQKEMYDIFESTIIIFLLKFARNQQFIQDSELFGHFFFIFR